MRARAIIHVAGPTGAGKTAFIESFLSRYDGLVLIARCERDEALGEPRESSPKRDPELARYRKVGASGVARYSFPATSIGTDDFYLTDLMQDFSHAVILEGDNPCADADARVFVAPPLPRGEQLLRRQRRKAGARSQQRPPEIGRMLQDPRGVAGLLGDALGLDVEELLRRDEDALRSVVAAMRAPVRPTPTGPTWTLAEGYEGLELADVVIVNRRPEDDAEQIERMLGDVRRLRKDAAVFADVIGWRGHRTPITARAVDLSDPGDPGHKQLQARLRRTIRKATED